MPGFKRSVTIARPVEEVFDFATDIANASVLLPGVTKVEMVTDGGMKPGAKFRETRLMNGKERSAVIEIVDHKRPEIHSARAAMMGMQATYIFRFHADGAGTRGDGSGGQGKLSLVAISRHDVPDDGKRGRRIPESHEGRHDVAKSNLT